MPVGVGTVIGGTFPFTMTGRGPPMGQWVLGHGFHSPADRLKLAADFSAP